jgi:hypothetical protein
MQQQHQQSMLPPPPPGVTLPTQTGPLQERSPNIQVPHAQKRKRADTAGRRTPPCLRDIPRLRAAVDTMDIQSLRDLVMVTATRDVAVAENLLQRHDLFLQKERTKTLDFLPFVDEVERILFGHKEPSGSKRFDMKHDILSTITDIIGNRIGNNVKEGSSWGTKISALKTLLKIGQMLCETAVGRVARDIQISFQTNRTLQDVMLRIVNCMPASERIQVWEFKDHDGSFFDNLKKMQEESVGLYLFEGLDEVVDMLCEHEHVQGNPIHSSPGTLEREEEANGEDHVSLPPHRSHGCERFEAVEDMTTNTLNQAPPIEPLQQICPPVNTPPHPLAHAIASGRTLTKVVGGSPPTQLVSYGPDGSRTSYGGPPTHAFQLEVQQNGGEWRLE